MDSGPLPGTGASHMGDAERPVLTSGNSPGSRVVRKAESIRNTLGTSLLELVQDPTVFNPFSPNIKNELVQVIVQYLQDEGYANSSLILLDEANTKMKNASSKRSNVRKIKRAILSGEWSEVESILESKATLFRHQNHFLYAVYKQQFLERVDSQQPQNALTILSGRLKPLERFAYSKTEFRDLCYLLTCQSVSECDQFSDWDGVNSARVALADQCTRLLDVESFFNDSTSNIPSVSVRGVTADGNHEAALPPSRLLHLLRQALAFQVDSSRYELEALPRIGSIVEDFECMVVPNARSSVFAGHRGNVKCVSFVGREGNAIVTGSSDNTARLWSTGSGKTLSVLTGHRSRIWDTSAVSNGSFVATASADGTVCVWDAAKVLRSSGSVETAARLSSWDDTEDSVSSLSTGVEHCSAPVATLGVVGGADMYALAFHPNDRLLLAGGYDHDAKLYDVETQRVLCSFAGHESAISSIVFNGAGTLAITGSKDATVRCWDVLSGLCVNTISSHLGEVTCVQTDSSGSLMLTSSKDNSNRLWDIRQCKPFRKYKKHQNTSKNYIKACFGPKEQLVVGGSEDGFVYMWDKDTTEILRKLGPAPGPTYGVEWNVHQGLLASCSHDCVASTWSYVPATGSETPA